MFHTLVHLEWNDETVFLQFPDIRPNTFSGDKLYKQIKQNSALISPTSSLYISEFTLVSVFIKRLVNNTETTSKP